MWRLDNKNMNRKKENKEICKARISDAGGSFEELYAWFKKHRPAKKKTMTVSECRNEVLELIDEMYEDRDRK